MHIDCPDCGGRVELNQSGIIPYHDNGSPIVCAGSGRQVSAASTQPSCTWCDAELEESDELARAEEREACAARLEESTRLLDGLAAECIAGSESRRIYETQAETLRAAIDAIRARSKDGAR